MKKKVKVESVAHCRHGVEVSRHCQSCPGLVATLTEGAQPPLPYTPSPGALYAPRPYQTEMAFWLNDHPFKGRLCADPMGVGKTLQGIMASRIRRARGLNAYPVSLVMTSANSAFDWAREVKNFWPEAKAVMLGSGKQVARRKGETDGSLKHRREVAVQNAEWRKVLRVLAELEEGFLPQEHTFIIGDYWWADVVLEYVTELRAQRDEQGLPPFFIDDVLGDEFHLVSTVGSRRENAFAMLVQMARQASFFTATPATNKAVKVFNLLKLMDPVRHTNLYKWARPFFHFETKDVQAAGRTFTTIGDVKEPALLAEAIKPYIWKREDLLGKGLPPRNFTVRYVELDKLPKMSPAKLRVSKSENIQELLGDLVELKLNAAVERAKSFDKPVVFYTYRPIHAEMLAEKLRAEKYIVTLATGGQTPKARDAAVQNWKAGQGGLFLVASMDALKESATLTRADTEIFVDIHVVPSTMIQVMGRIDPARQKENERRPVFYELLVTKNGPDEVVANTLVQKLTDIEGLGLKDGTASDLKNFLKSDVGPGSLPVLSDEEILKDMMERLNARAERLSEVGLWSSEA